MFNGVRLKIKKKKIIKEIKNDRSQTKVLDLGYDERVMEIASMISGETISISSMEMAKELLSTKDE